MSPQHKDLMSQYIASLRDARKVAEQWWDSLISEESTVARGETKSDVRRRWPDGPASHPRVIHTIQKYLHACDALNRTLGKERSIYLNQFIIDGLDRKDSQDIVDFTDALTYWPIGLDEFGRPV